MGGGNHGHEEWGDMVRVHECMSHSIHSKGHECMQRKGRETGDRVPKKDGERDTDRER